MRQIAIICVSLLAVLFGSGCVAEKQVVYVPQKCKVVISPMPSVEQCENKDVLEWGQCAYRNYVKMKEYNEVVRAEAKVCE